MAGEQETRGIRTCLCLAVNLERESGDLGGGGGCLRWVEPQCQFRRRKAESSKQGDFFQSHPAGAGASPCSKNTMIMMQRQKWNSGPHICEVCAPPLELWLCGGFVVVVV